MTNDNDDDDDGNDFLKNKSDTIHKKKIIHDNSKNLHLLLLSMNVFEYVPFF